MVEWRHIREYGEKVNTLFLNSNGNSLVGSSPTTPTMGKYRNYTIEDIKESVRTSLSIADVLRKLNLAPLGGNYRTIKTKIIQYNIDTSHFTEQGWNKYGHKSFGNSGKPLSAVLNINSSLSSFNIKERLFNNKLKENKCELCGISEWLGKPINCELHHINGDTTDNRIENLQILCPNCHSQTDNFRRRNSIKNNNP